MIVEQVYGRMKGRSHILMYPITSKDLWFVNKLVKACLLLHNFLIPHPSRTAKTSTTVQPGGWRRRSNDDPAARSEGRRENQRNLTSR